MSRTCQKDDSAIFEGEPLRCRHERATVRLPDGTTLDGRPKSLPMSSIVPTDRNRVSYSLSTPSVPTVDAWAVRDARTDVSADVIIWSHSVSAPGPEAVFIPVLKTPLVPSSRPPAALLLLRRVSAEPGYAGAHRATFSLSLGVLFCPILPIGQIAQLRRRRLVGLIARLIPCAEPIPGVVFLDLG